MEATPTADLDRQNDKTYECTTRVVKSIMELTQAVQNSGRVEYIDLVRNVGIELRALLGSVDNMVYIFPDSAKDEVKIYTKSILLHLKQRMKITVGYKKFAQVEMAHKVLSTDMKELVNSMRLAEKNSSTLLDAEYKK